MEDHPSDDESFPRPRRAKPLQLLEVVTAGLQNNTPKKLKFVDTENKGRGVAADEDIEKQEYVVEYKYSDSYPLKERKKREQEYIENGEGCFILEVQLPKGKGWKCLDATRNPKSWGRYINHSATPNLKMYQPVMVRERWRVGFTAIRNIERGEELCYDYGRQKNQPDWMDRRRKKLSLQGTSHRAAVSNRPPESDDRSLPPPPDEVTDSNRLGYTANPPADSNLLSPSDEPSDSNRHAADSSDRTDSSSLPYENLPANSQDSSSLPNVTVDVNPPADSHAPSDEATDSNMDVNPPADSCDPSSLLSPSDETTDGNRPVVLANKDTPEQGQTSRKPTVKVPDPTKQSVQSTPGTECLGMPTTSQPGQQRMVTRQSNQTVLWILAVTHPHSAKQQQLITPESASQHSATAPPVARESSQGQTSAVECERCPSQERAVIFCVTCYETLCIKCHQSLSGHSVVSMSHFIKKRDTDSCESCRSGNRAELFCKTCQSSLCKKCIQQHRNNKGLQKHSLVALKEEGLCESCPSGDKPELFCKTCQSSLCKKCIQQHRHNKGLKKHDLVHLEDKKSKTECYLCFSGMHPEGYCHDCDSYLCLKCILEHARMSIFSQHNITPIEESQEPPSPSPSTSQSYDHIDLTVDSSTEKSSEDDTPQKLRQASRKRSFSTSEEDSNSVGSDLDDLWVAGNPNKRYKVPYGSIPHFLDDEYTHAYPDDYPMKEDEEERSDNESNVDDDDGVDDDDELQERTTSEENKRKDDEDDDEERTPSEEREDFEEPQIKRKKCPVPNCLAQPQANHMSNFHPELTSKKSDDTDDVDDNDCDYDDDDVLNKAQERTPSEDFEKPKSKKIKRKNTERYRKYRMCPVTGCPAKPQKKLSNHLTKYHSELTSKEKRRMLKRAKIVNKPHLKIVSGQAKLPFKSSHLGSKSGKGKERMTKGRGVTKSLPYFPSTHPELVAFKNYLMGLAGKKRTESAAQSIIRDISKMLYFYDSESLNWVGITDRQNLLKYMDHMDQLKVGPEGQLTKLERACDLLQYLKRRYWDDDSMRNQILHTENEIQVWKRTLRGEKKALQVKRMEELSEQDLSLDEITAVVDNTNVWLKFSEIVRQAKHGEPVSDVNLKLAMGVVLVSVKLKSFSRPGAIVNCTVDEYHNAVTCDGSTVIKVYNHKTANQGTAKITIDEQLMDRLRLYFHHIRPLLVEPGHDIPNLFILPGSQKIAKVSNLESFLKRRLMVDIPSSTKARKIGATCAARALDYQTNTLVTKQMSHNPDVSRRYYEAVRGSSDAAFAFKQMEALRKGEPTSRMRMTSPKPASTFENPKPSTSCDADAVPSSRWTQKDTKFVKAKFAKQLQQLKTPSLCECEDLGLNKSAKQIQDKVRTLIRQMKKAAEEV